MSNFAIVLKIFEVVRPAQLLLYFSVDERVDWRLFCEDLVEVRKIVQKPHLGLEGWLDLKSCHLLPIDTAEENVLPNFLRVVFGTKPLLLTDLDESLNEVLELG